MPTSRQSTFALLVLLSLPAGATDYVVEYDGGPPPAPIYGALSDDMFFGDPIFHRPRVQCSGELTSGDYRYDTITLINTGTSGVEISLDISTGFCDDAHNSVVYGYSPSFFPDDPHTNCFVFNDDDHRRCSFVSTAIAPNQTVVFVVASYWANHTWP